MERSDLVTEKILVMGHKNPDTDSICAAIAYAQLKNHETPGLCQAVRLGEVGPETQFVLDRFQVKAPDYVETMRLRVKDLEMDVPQSVDKSLSIGQAISLMRQSNRHVLTVVDEDNTLYGIVSMGNITRVNMEILDPRILGRADTPLENIVEMLDGKILFRPEHPQPHNGNIAVHTMLPEGGRFHFAPGDIVLTADRPDAQKDALDHGVALLILTLDATISEELLALAKEKGTTILSTPLDTYRATRRLPQSIPLSFVCSKEDLVTFHSQDFLGVVRRKMEETRYRAYPVLDEHEQVVGMISRYHLLTARHPKVILVDHNERSQSVDDLEEAEILEIIDHHRVANISTQGPVFFRNEPVGSTCTIVARMYLERGLTPKKDIAGLLCAGILSDTLAFRSPTTTETDRQILEVMAKIARIDPNTFSRDMFEAGTDLSGRTPKELLHDAKTFLIGDLSIRVAQIFTTNAASFGPMKDEVLEDMRQRLSRSSDDVFILLLTNILEEFSDVYVQGADLARYAELFHSTAKEDHFRVKRLLSRKKQVVPTLTEGLRRMPFLFHKH